MGKNLMAILSLQIDNYKRIETLFIKPDGAVTELTGANGAGKSSALHAIAALLGGEEHIAWKPIRNGAEQAKITAVIAGIGKTNLTVTRKIWKKKGSGEVTSTITIESEEGARFPSPQAMLDGVINKYTFDPLAFTRQKPKEQVLVLQDLSGIDLDKFDADNAKDRDARTVINRRANELSAQASGIAIPENPPAGRVDEAALIEEMQNAGEHNAEIERSRAEREAITQYIAVKLSSAEKYKTEAAVLRRRAGAIEETAKELISGADAERNGLMQLPPLPEPIDASVIRKQIEQARLTNAIVDRVKRHSDLLADAEIAEAQSDALTANIKKREDDKLAAIASAKMPVDGLGFGDGMVTFNEMPLDQASQAEQIRISVAIAAALNPTLKVAFIHDGSLLDKHSWALLEKFATEHGLQVFVETVDSTRPTAIVIEDGKRKEPVSRAAE